MRLVLRNLFPRVASSSASSGFAYCQQQPRRAKTLCPTRGNMRSSRSAKMQKLISNNQNVKVPTKPLAVVIPVSLVLVLAHLFATVTASATHQDQSQETVSTSPKTRGDGGGLAHLTSKYYTNVTTTLDVTPHSVHATDDLLLAASSTTVASVSAPTTRSQAPPTSPTAPSIVSSTSTTQATATQRVTGDATRVKATSNKSFKKHQKQFSSLRLDSLSPSEKKVKFIRQTSNQKSFTLKPDDVTSTNSAPVIRVARQQQQQQLVSSNHSKQIVENDIGKHQKQQVGSTAKSSQPDQVTASSNIKTTVHSELTPSASAKWTHFGARLKPLTTNTGSSDHYLAANSKSSMIAAVRPNPSAAVGNYNDEDDDPNTDDDQDNEALLYNMLQEPKSSVPLLQQRQQSGPNVNGGPMNNREVIRLMKSYSHIHQVDDSDDKPRGHPAGNFNDEPLSQRVQQQQQRQQHHHQQKQQQQQQRRSRIDDKGPYDRQGARQQHQQPQEQQVFVRAQPTNHQLAKPAIRPTNDDDTDDDSDGDGQSNDNGPLSLQPASPGGSSNNNINQATRALSASSSNSQEHDAGHQQDNNGQTDDGSQHQAASGEQQGEGGEEEDMCPDDGIFADEASGCQSYLVCQSGAQVQQVFQCPMGTLFNNIILTCDFAHNVQCGKGSKLGQQHHQAPNSASGEIEKTPAAVAASRREASNSAQVQRNNYPQQPERQSWQPAVQQQPARLPKYLDVERPAREHQAVQAYSPRQASVSNQQRVLPQQEQQSRQQSSQLYNQQKPANGVESSEQDDGELDDQQPQLVPATLPPRVASTNQLAASKQQQQQLPYLAPPEPDRQFQSAHKSQAPNNQLLSARQQSGRGHWNQQQSQQTRAQINPFDRNNNNIGDYNGATVMKPVFAAQEPTVTTTTTKPINNDQQQTSFNIVIDHSAGKPSAWPTASHAAAPNQQANKQQVQLQLQPQPQQQPQQPQRAIQQTTQQQQYSLQSMKNYAKLKSQQQQLVKVPSASEHRANSVHLASPSQAKPVHADGQQQQQQQQQQQKQHAQLLQAALVDLTNNQRVGVSGEAMNQGLLLIVRHANDPSSKQVAFAVNPKLIRPNSPLDAQLFPNVQRVLTASAQNSHNRVAAPMTGHQSSSQQESQQQQVVVASPPPSTTRVASANSLSSSHVHVPLVRLEPPKAAAPKQSDQESKAIVATTTVASRTQQSYKSTEAPELTTVVGSNNEPTQQTTSAIGRATGKLVAKRLKAVKLPVKSTGLQSTMASSGQI